MKPFLCDVGEELKYLLLHGCVNCDLTVTVASIASTKHKSDCVQLVYGHNNRTNIPIYLFNAKILQSHTKRSAIADSLRTCRSAGGICVNAK